MYAKVFDNPKYRVLSTFSADFRNIILQSHKLSVMYEFTHCRANTKVCVFSFDCFLANFSELLFTIINAKTT